MQDKRSIGACGSCSRQSGGENDATWITRGIPLSTYVRACRMACLERGVPYEFDSVMPQSDEQKAMQP